MKVHEQITLSSGEQSLCKEEDNVDERQILPDDDEQEKFEIPQSTNRVQNVLYL